MRGEKSKKTHFEITAFRGVFTVGVPLEVEDKPEVLDKLCGVFKLKIEKI